MLEGGQNDKALSVPDKLREWNLSQYIEVFQAQAIDEKKFIVITSEDVKELIPILGHRMDFISNRLAYLKSQRLPDPDELFANLDDTVSLISDTTSDSTSSSEPIAAIPRQEPIIGEQLKRLLQKSPKGQALLKCIRLTSHERKKLSEIIIDHVMITTEKAKRSDFEFWTQEITAVFRFELPEIYFVPYQSGPKKHVATGKLWDKYCNIRRYIKGKLVASTPANDAQLGPVSAEVQDALLKLRAISPQDGDLKRLWRLTSQYRTIDGSITDYFNKYPILCSATGSSLLQIDFEEARLTKSTILIETWSSIATKIIDFVRHKNICEDLFHEQATAETLGFLVLPYLFRTTRITTKRGTNWRPSQPEVAKAFVLQIPTAADYERCITERQTTLAKYGVTLQPFILTVGSKSSFSAVYVVIDTTKYECSSLMGAVDLCFKAIWALRAQYQGECESVWNFLQRCEACAGLVAIKDFHSHCKYIHGNANQAVMRCAVDNCDRSFSHVNSARKHAKTHEVYSGVEPQMANHRISNILISGEQVQNDSIRDEHTSKYQIELFDTPSVETKNDNIGLLKRKVLSFTSSFYADTSLSRIQVQRIIKSFQEFLNADEVNTFRDEILGVVSTERKEFVEQQFHKFQSIFDDVDSEYKRLAEFEKQGCYIRPVPLFVGTLQVSRRNGTMTTKNIYCQYIPIKETIKSFMETPGIYSSIRLYLNELTQNDHDIENIVQSKLWKQKEFGEKQVFPLLIYQDDFETGNPLGSRAGIHKLNGTYLSIGCIPPAYRSRLVNIFLVQLCHSADYKNLDCAIIYKRLIDDLNDVAENGIQLNVDGLIFVCHFKLAVIIGDNLGLNSTLGFSESFSANYSCRFCKASKARSKLLCSEIGCVMRNRDNYSIDLSRKNLSQTGIKTECIWHRIVDFHATENYSVDIMHDLLEGVCKFETAHLLQYLIVKKKYATLETVNNRMKYYKYPVSSNPPPLISNKELSDSNIRLTAAEMKTFMLHASLMLGDLVAEHDKHWELYILLRKILCICLQIRVSCETANVLENLIEKHHFLYVELHGNTLKPKHHHMLHYSRIMREIGPLRHIWSMRFEANHRALKKTSAVSFNRINICKTLAVKNQLHFNNAILRRQFFEEDITFKMSDTSPPHPDGVEPVLPPEFDQFREIAKLSVNGTKFTLGDVILVRLGELPVFGEVLKVFVKKDILSPTLVDFAFLVRMFETACLSEHLQAYKITKTKVQEFASFNPIDYTEKLSVVLSSDGNSYIACDESTNTI